MAGARQVAETVVPQLAAPLQPSVTITTKPGTCVDAAAMHASFWNASFWTPRSRLAAGPAAQPGYNVISSGVPHSPASKLPSLQVDALPVRLALGITGALASMLTCRQCRQAGRCRMQPVGPGPHSR